MTANIVLPPLKTWAEQHLSSIIKATTQTAFDAAFDAFLSKHATVTVNGKHLSRDAYKKQLQGEGFDEAGAIVTFSGAVEVPTDQKNPIQAGVVGLFYTADISENIVIHDASVQSHITSSLNLVIEEDKSLTPPHLPSGVRGFFDGRRVTVLNQIIIDSRSN
ncbi:hypothetical protein B0H15DRAFT_501276 [Mycena belliarum]|uniref:Uncharacterized protein n=1 Tax=Mycena belliarum TaxID=1033014 RepID=A0AAD6XM63_9AGAR|nr:hypothetical protein B0H15DRAFT_501276 [Mycena belliae]